MEILPEAQIKAVVKGGSVFYFVEETFRTKKPHYFVVLNKAPVPDNGVVLVCAVTLDLKVAERSLSLGLPIETFVQATSKDCAFLKHPTLFDCNTAFSKPMEVLIEKFSNKELRLCGKVSEKLLNQLRSGVLVSPMITPAVKDWLR